MARAGRKVAKQVEKALELSVATPRPPRFELVRLEATDAAGLPIVVRCEVIRAEHAVGITQRLPGDVVKLGAGDSPNDLPNDRLPLMLELAQRLVQHGTALAAPDGGFVRPAFWFTEESPRHEMSLDGRELTVNDIVLMGNTILKLSGYGGGAAGRTFPG